MVFDLPDMAWLSRVISVSLGQSRQHALESLEAACYGRIQSLSACMTVSKSLELLELQFLPLQSTNHTSPTLLKAR
jgi:hypothetical protein